jgi:hypothetical protein
MPSRLYSELLIYGAAYTKSRLCAEPAYVLSPLYVPGCYVGRPVCGGVLCAGAAYIASHLYSEPPMCGSCLYADPLLREALMNRPVMY